MIWPPSILRIRVARPGRRRIGLWLPLFLLWPLLLVLAALLGTLALVAMVLMGRRGTTMLRGLGRLFVMACAVRGLKVDVDQPDGKFMVSFV